MRRGPRPAVLFGFLLLLAACSAVPARPDPPGVPRPVPVIVIARDWHTEIGLRAEDLTGPLAGLRARFPAARTLLFGFGNRRYMAETRPGFGDTLLAALPGPAALLVIDLSTTPEAAFGSANVVRIMLSEDGARRAAAYVSNSFAHGETGAPVGLGDGPYPGSALYAASIPYSLSHTCNTWTAEVLAGGGAAVSPDGVVTADEVMARARTAEATTGK